MASGEMNLSFQELLAKAKDINSGTNCCYIYQLGVMFVKGEDESQEGEEFFLGLLDSERTDDRFYGYCYLTAVREKSLKVKIRLKEFKRDPENTGIIKDAQNEIAFLQSKIQ